MVVLAPVQDVGQTSVNRLLNPVLEFCNKQLRSALAHWTVCGPRGVRMPHLVISASIGPWNLLHRHGAASNTYDQLRGNVFRATARLRLNLADRAARLRV